MRNKGIGSAKVLEGRIYVLSIFVAETAWDLNEKLEVFKIIRDGETWLEQQAAAYGKSVTFVNGERGVFKPFIAPAPPDYESGKPSVTFVKEYLAKAGYPTGRAFLDWAKERAGCPQALVFVVVNKYGRGYALPFYTEGPDWAFLEGCVLYHSPEWKLESWGVAHEFLHLFGAWDLYQTNVQSEENSRRMDGMYPNEVMHRGAPLDKLQLSPLTAWLVGLNEKKEDWFESFRPRGG